MTETGKEALLRIYTTLSVATMTGAWDTEPYAVISRGKYAGSHDNLLPNRKALRLLKRLDRRMNDLANEFEDKADWLFKS